MAKRNKICIFANVLLRTFLKNDQHKLRSMTLSMPHLPNLLIVDDTIENLLLLEAIIKPVNVNLIQAISGHDALEKTKGIELALALIDVKMPAMNGYELALKLNEGRSGEKVPIIFITANYNNINDIFKGYNHGAVDYILKPFKNIVLLSKILVFIDLFNQKQTIIRNSILLEKSADELIMVNKAINKSEKKYRNYIDNAPDGVFVADETGKYLEVNKAICRITGYSKRELLKMSMSDILPEELHCGRMTEFVKAIKSKHISPEVLFIHKEGSIRWWALEIVMLSEARFLGFAKDITKRKMAEEELKNSLEQLHQLTNHTEKVRESERVAISRDLHDDLGQSLTAVKIDLGIINRQVIDMDVVLKVDKASALVSETIKTVQRITSELRPQIIDDLGLEAAIDWHTGEFAERTGVEVFLDLDSEIPISADASLTLFRIMQESLTNIARHSKASRVEIRLKNVGDHVDFRIADNGIGIIESQIKLNNSFGIMGMKERAASLGGTLDICKSNDRGTIIKLILPKKK